MPSLLELVPVHMYVYTHWFFILPLANDGTDLLENDLSLGTGEFEHMTAIHQPHSKAALVLNKNLKIMELK